MVAVLVLVSLPLQSVNSSSAESTTNDLAGNFPGSDGPFTVNTIAYVENAVQANLVLPNASVLGLGFRIVGARVAQNPLIQNDTFTGGTFRSWVVVIYITNQPFINGTTTYDAFFSNVIVVGEASAAPGGNSSAVAQGQLQPNQSCEIKNPGSESASTTCSEIQGPAQDVVQIGDTYLAVIPSGPSAFFMIGTDGPIVMIGSKSSLMSYPQMLALASDMISSASASPGR